VKLTSSKKFFPLTRFSHEKRATLAAWMSENIPDGFACFSYVKRARKLLRTTNMLERLNKEIKRRTIVIGIFPNLVSLKVNSVISGCHRRDSDCPVAFQNIKKLRENTALHKKY
jgi:transposase-like protein